VTKKSGSRAGDSVFCVYLVWYSQIGTQWKISRERAQRKVELVFFRNNAGCEPVRDWLKGMDEQDRHAIRRDLLRAQWRWPVGMPLCRPMGKGLWEVRTGLPGNRTARVLICFYQSRLVALHGFIKKTRTTPADDLALARTRQKELER
jgi:phage-related protein